MRKVIAAIAFALSLGLISANADVVLGVGDSLGSFQSFPGDPANLIAEASYINTILSSYPPGTYPPATAVGGVQGSSSNTGIDVTGFTYILGKYDGQNGGYWVWYVLGLNDKVDIPLNLPDANKYALSHYALFNPTTAVPDGGLTLMLLGGALIGLETLRRRVNA